MVQGEDVLGDRLASPIASTDETSKLIDYLYLFSVGSVEGVPFTACTSGPDIIILASNFSRVQQITTGSSITSLDCSTDVGKIAAAYDSKIVIYEPISFVQPAPISVAKLDYKWIQTATIESDTHISVMSFNLEGTRLISGGRTIHMWIIDPMNKNNWQCVWSCKIAKTITHLKFSPDGTMFCSAVKSDKLVKIWHECVTVKPSNHSSSSSSSTSSSSSISPSPTSTIATSTTATINKTPSTNIIASTATTTTTNEIANSANNLNATKISFQNSSSQNPAIDCSVSSTNQRSNSNNSQQQPQPTIGLNTENESSNFAVETKFDFSFIYIAHPSPITGLEWRRTSKYTSRYAVANILITSCKDNIARIWVQTTLPDNVLVNFRFHLAAIIESDSCLNTKSLSSLSDISRDDSLNTSLDQTEKETDPSQFVVHWVNNKEIHITRSIEVLLHDMLLRMLKGNQNSSSTNSPRSTAGSCSGLENDTDDPVDANDDTITAESSKKLRHKLCRKMNKQRALAASGRKEQFNPGDNTIDRNSNNNNTTNQVKTSQPSLVEEFDRTLETLLKRWQMSSDLLFSINRADGTLTLWQAKYLDGEYAGVYRQVQIEKVSQLDSILPRYDATTMSLNVAAYSPSPFLDVKRAYLAVTNSSGSNNPRNSLAGEKLSPVDIPEILSINTESTLSTINANKQANDGQDEYKDNASAISSTESEPNIFIVTQHLSGILGLWKLNFDSNYPKIQGIDLITRITGLPIDPIWLQDGTLAVEYLETNNSLRTEWLPDNTRNRRVIHQNSKNIFSPSQVNKYNPYSFDEIKSSLIPSLPSVEEEAANRSKTEIQESHFNDKDFYRASQMANSINILPQYHPKQLIELLAFGKLPRVKAILNHLMNCLVSSEASQEKEIEPEPSHWAHRSRTLSIVASSPPAFHDSFDVDNPSSTIQQQVIEEIELDYIEVTSMRPLPLYSIIEADNEKSNSCDNKSSVQEEFSASYESIMRARSQVDATLDEILGQSTLETMNKHKELEKIVSEPNTKGSLTSFNLKKAKILTSVLTHTHLPGLSSLDQMHLLAVADAVALFDATADDINDLHSEDNTGVGTSIAIDSLDDRGLRFLTAMRQHVYLTRCLPMKQRNELRSTGIGNHNLVWAFHSETQDELISLIPCVQRNKPEWSELREFGIGWWLKKPGTLRKLIEKVAQSAYQARQDPLDAALFYLAMKKKTLVCALLRRVNCDKRLLKLFEQDFNDPVNRKKALKNAYALLGLHRFEHAAAFFILAGSIWDAVEVCINNLNDIQLGMVLIRLHDSDLSTQINFKRLLSTEILGLKRPIEQLNQVNDVNITQNIHNSESLNNNINERRISNASVRYNYDPKQANADPFLRSMSFWLLGDYLSSVHTLLESDSSSISASVFNFYLFLKDKPLVVKHRQQLIEELEIRKRTSPVDEEKVHCHRARSLSSGELGFDEGGISRAIKQSSTEFEILNETNRLVDKYSDEAIAEKERILFFSTAQAYLDAGSPLLSLEVLCSKDHLNMSKAQRMKFIACLHILMNELNCQKFGDQFLDWIKQNASAMNKICSYTQGDDLNWVKVNEPILRAMLTYCNLRCLTTIRSELLSLLNK